MSYLSLTSHSQELVVEGSPFVTGLVLSFEDHGKELSFGTHLFSTYEGDWEEYLSRIEV